MRGRVLIVVVWIALGIPVALLLAFLGVPLEFAVAWILVFAAALLIARQNFLDESGPWPPAPPDVPRRGSDVSRLAWSIDSRTGAVGPSLRQRITAIADRRLRAYGVRLDTAEASAVDAVLAQLGERPAQARDNADPDRLLPCRLRQPQSAGAA